MGERIHRRTFFRANKYERGIIGLAVFVTLTLSVLMSLFIISFHRELVDYILYSTHPPSVRLLNQWSLIILVVLWIFFAIIVIWAFYLANNLVGAFERIIRELDGILQSGQKRHLHARPHDRLANELLKRINALIDKIPGPNTHGDASKSKGRF